MGNTYKGIDVSNNDNAIDFSKVASDGYTIAYLKATEGGSFRDSYMNTFYTDAKAQGIKVGAYHFLVGTATPEAQAQNFYEKIKDYSWDLIPMMDIETNFDGLCDYVTRFITEFNSLCSLQLGVYTYTSFLGYLTGIESTIANLPVWIANYNNDPWNISTSFFTKLCGHQFSEKGSVSGVNCNCDLDVFNDNVFLDSTIAGTWTQGTGDNSTKWWYKHNDGTYTSNGWEKIDSKWYYFDSEGYMKTGWIQDGDKYYLLNSSSGEMLIGWQLIDNKYYYLNLDKGYMEKGFINIDSKWYFLNRDSGELVTGWIKDGDKLYCAYSDGSLIHDTVAYGYKFNSDCVGEKLATPSKTN